MNNKFLIIAAVLIIVGGLFYFLGSRQDNDFSEEKAIVADIIGSNDVDSGTSTKTSISSATKISNIKIALLIDGQDTLYKGKGVAKGCDKVVLVERKITPTDMPLNASLRLLFSDKTPWPYQLGVPGNFVGGRPDFPITFSKATLEKGVAKVYLYGEIGLSGVCDDPRLVSQVEATAFQFPSVKSVKIYLNDKEWATPSQKGN